MADESLASVHGVRRHRRCDLTIHRLREVDAPCPTQAILVSLTGDPRNGFRKFRAVTA